MFIALAFSFFFACFFLSFAFASFVSCNIWEAISQVGCCMQPERQGSLSLSKMLWSSILVVSASEARELSASEERFEEELSLGLSSRKESWLWLWYQYSAIIAVLSSILFLCLSWTRSASAVTAASCCCCCLSASSSSAASRPVIALFLLLGKCRRLGSTKMLWHCQ